MATRIWQAGFEMGNLSELNAYGSCNIGSPGYTGSYRVNGAGYSNGTYYRASISSAATKQVRGAVHVYHGQGGGGPATRLLRANSNGEAIENFSIRAAPGSTQLTLTVLGTLRDTYNVAPYLTWYSLGYDIKIDSTNGWIYIYQDGQPILSYTGNTGSLNLDYLKIGPQSGLIIDCFYPYGSIHIDDWYIDDVTGDPAPITPSILRFYPLTVNGAGNYSQWTPSSGSGFQCVDEIPPNTSDYVQSEAVGDKDSYNMTTYTLDVDEVCKAITPLAYAKRGGSTEKLILGTRAGGADQFGSEQALPSGSWGWISERFEEKPGGGAWDQSALDEVELVIKSGGTYT